MADQFKLSAQRREVTGKAVSQMRREGITPIIVYGRGVEPVALQTPTKELVRVLSKAGGTQLIALSVEGERAPRMTLVRDVQRHVTRLTPLHVDFLQVDLNKPIVSSVPLVAEGEPELLARNQAILQMPLNSVVVEALPADLPSAIHVDLSVLTDFDAVVHIRDLDPGPSVQIQNDPDELVARLTPAFDEVIEEAAAEELVTPEAEAAESVEEPEAAEEPGEEA
jgi:large subunit ribosomal protein L25